MDRNSARQFDDAVNQVEALTTTPYWSVLTGFFDSRKKEQDHAADFYAGVADCRNKGDQQGAEHWHNLGVDCDRRAEHYRQCICNHLVELETVRQLVKKVAPLLLHYLPTPDWTVFAAIDPQVEAKNCTRLLGELLVSHGQNGNLETNLPQIFPKGLPPRITPETLAFISYLQAKGTQWGNEIARNFLRETGQDETRAAALMQSIYNLANKGKLDRSLIEKSVP